MSDWWSWVGARRVVRRAFALSLVAVSLLAVAARAAELVEAEMDGTANAVTVEQGGSASFTVKVKATGSIRCSATPENPATARLDTVFSIASGGTVSSSNPSAPLAFYGAPPSGGVCDVTWGGDPIWLAVHATVSAAIDAPLGNRTVRLRPQLSTPPGTGATLRDDTPTLLTFTVVEGSDRVPPSVDCSGPEGAAGDHGWYRSTVWYDCVASDAGSGLADSADAAFALATSGEGEEWTAEHSVADRMGNATTAGPYGSFRVDLHDPTVDLDVPADGASYVLGAEVRPDFSCDDTAEGSGVESCEGAGSVDTTTVGSHEFTVVARDRSGRARTVTHSYAVVYDFEGVFRPAHGGLNVLRAGTALPLRWSLGGVSDLDSFLWARSVEAACDAPPGDDAVEPIDAPGSSELTYDSGTDRFGLVWKTDRAWAGTCRQLQIGLADGTVHAANFSFR